MKRGLIVLISGAVLLLVGIIISAIWAVQFADSFLRDNTIVAQASIDAGRSVDSRIDVNQLDRPVSLAIGIDRSGQIQQQQQPQIPSSSSSSSSNVRLKEVVTDPNGRVVSSNEFGDSFFTSFKPEVAGTYTVTVTNLGTNPVTVSGAFGYMPFNALGEKPNTDSMLGSGGLGMIIGGGTLTGQGVVTLILGAIITMIDSKRQSPTTTTEGGISYRKD